jgi:cysteine desulfurase
MPGSAVIYLDNNATTQTLPEVQEAMAEALRELYANPSSIHQFGQAVRHRVEIAREQVARLIGASSREIVFTSGGTESINLAIRGALRSHPGRRRVVTTAVEHSAVLQVVQRLAEEGYDVQYVGVDREGRINQTQWESKITPDTALVSFMHANNETGVIWDVKHLGDLAAKSGALIHVDAVQSAGKIPIDVTQWPAHLVSLSAHKFHGPKGVGALYIRRRTRIEPQIVGGSQESERRGGTENVDGIIGMGVAAEAAMRECQSVAQKVGCLRDALETGILGSIPGTHVQGAAASRIYNTSNISFEGLQSEAVLMVLSEAGICASAGAACSSGSLEPSHVLKAMGLDDAVAHGAVRFSLSRFNTEVEIDEAIRELPSILSPLMTLAGR